MLTRNALAVHQNPKYLWSAIESVHILILLQEANIPKLYVNTLAVVVYRIPHIFKYDVIDISLFWDEPNCTHRLKSVLEQKGGERLYLVLHPTKSSIENRQMHFVLFCFCLLRASPSHSSITNLINNNSNKLLYIFHIFDVVVSIVADPNKRSRKSLNKPIHFIF